MPGPKPVSRPRNRLMENQNFRITKELIDVQSKKITELKKKSNKTPVEERLLSRGGESSSKAKIILREFILRDYLNGRLLKETPEYRKEVLHEINKIELLKDRYELFQRIGEYDDVIKAIFRDLRGFEKGANKSGKLIRKESIPNNKILEYLRERRIILENRN